MAYNPHTPFWDRWFGPIQNFLDERSGDSLDRLNQTLNQPGLVRGFLAQLLGGGNGGNGGFLQGLFQRQMPNSLAAQLMGGPLNELRGINPQPMGPVQGKNYQMEANRGAMSRMEQNAGNNRYTKWDAAAGTVRNQQPGNLQWGNPLLGYYQPPNWAGWSDPRLASNQYNPNSANYGASGGMSDFLFGRPKR